jgi:hypothetical protein
VVGLRPPRAKSVVSFARRNGGSAILNLIVEGGRNVPQLEHWAEVRPVHDGILGFIQYLESEHGVDLDFHNAKEGTPLSIQQLVDTYLEIDRVALDDERLAALDRLHPEDLGDVISH